MFKPFTWMCNQRVFSFEKPAIMGILNVNDNSFFEGSRVTGLNELIDKAGKMLQDGADILDIGMQSTRPGAVQLGADKELELTKPYLETLRCTFPDACLSIDTYHATVAKFAMECKFDIINDISAGEEDAKMIDLISQANVGFVAMHKPAPISTVHREIREKERNITQLILEYFVQKKQELESRGIFQWMVDPGFGFGKSLEENFALLRNLQTLQILDKPILAGISRKRMVWQTLKTSANEALNGSTALHMVALQNGASVLRVHDVKEARECVQLQMALQ